MISIIQIPSNFLEDMYRFWSLKTFDFDFEIGMYLPDNGIVKASCSSAHTENSQNWDFFF